MSGEETSGGQGQVLKGHGGSWSPSTPATIPASTKCFHIHSQPMEREASLVCLRLPGEETETQSQEADTRSHRELGRELPPPHPHPALLHPSCGAQLAGRCCPCRCSNCKLLFPPAWQRPDFGGSCASAQKARATKTERAGARAAGVQPALHPEVLPVLTVFRKKDTGPDPRAVPALTLGKAHHRTESQFAHQ